jgi:hypothetical protein
LISIRKKTNEEVSNFTENSKLHLYSKLKHDLKMEEYLVLEISIERIENVNQISNK